VADLPAVGDAVTLSLDAADTVLIEDDHV